MTSVSVGTTRLAILQKECKWENSDRCLWCGFTGNIGFVNPSACLLPVGFPSNTSTGRLPPELALFSLTEQLFYSDLLSDIWSPQFPHELAHLGTGLLVGSPKANSGLFKGRCDSALIGHTWNKEMGTRPAGGYDRWTLGGWACYQGVQSVSARNNMGPPPCGFTALVGFCCIAIQAIGQHMC